MNLLSGVEQDFHHLQKSPGAYEWWHFDATDEKTGLSFTLKFFAGNLFSAHYQDSLKSYWQKTKSPLTTPTEPAIPAPNPLDYCGVSFQIFRNGDLIGEAAQEFSAQFLKASDQHPAVLLGPNRFNWDTGEPASYVITVQAPVQGGKKLLRARLFFTPLTSSLTDLPQPEIFSTHTWVLAAPLCHVEGTLEWCDANGNVDKELGFVGKGYHDHHFGSVPLDRFVKNWHWGRAFLGDKTLIYSVQTPQDAAEKTESIVAVFHKNKLESIERGPKAESTRNSRSFFWVPYAKELRFNQPAGLHIKHDGILSDGPASLILKDKVEFKDGSKGFGLSSYLYTPRLSSSFFFPMLKGKTTFYTQKQEIKVKTLDDPKGDVFTDRPDKIKKGLGDYAQAPPQLLI